MRSYATEADLTTANVVVTPSSDAPQYLQSASELVEDATIVDLYEVDDDGLPTDPEIIEAFKNATVAQIRFWVAAKVNPVGGVLAQSPEVSSQSTDGSSVSYGSLRTAEELEKATSSLCEQAQRILRLARLTDGNARPTLW